MKKIMAVFLTVTMIFAFCGCMETTNSVTINQDGSGSSETIVDVDKEMYDSMLDVAGNLIGGEDFDPFDGETPVVVTKDGKEYYETKDSKRFANYAELKKLLSEEYQDVYASESGIRFAMEALMTSAEYEEAKSGYASLGVDMEDLLKITISITMPKQIVKVSKFGTISEDGLTASFNVTMKDCTKALDFVVSTAEEKTAPTVTGVAAGKTYNKAVTFKVKDISGIASASYSKAGESSKAFSLSKKVTKSGKYTVTATDYYGNKKIVTFTIKDKTKPTVIGVKNNNVYKSKRTIKYKDNCGISKATLNGKKITNGKTVSKKGSYKLVVTDVNGLKTTVKFKIK